MLTCCMYMYCMVYALNTRLGLFSHELPHQPLALSRSYGMKGSFNHGPQPICIVVRGISHFLDNTSDSLWGVGKERFLDNHARN